MVSARPRGNTVERAPAPQASANTRWRRHAAGARLLGFASAAVALTHGAAAGVGQSAQVGVSVVQDGSSVLLRVRLPPGVEPDLAWSGTAQSAPYRLALVWNDSGTDKAHSPPPLPAHGRGPVQSVALSQDGDTTRLEFELREPVSPWLRRSGDAWDLRLLPAPAAAAADSPAPAPALGTAAAAATPAPAPAAPVRRDDRVAALTAPSRTMPMPLSEPVPAPANRPAVPPASAPRATHDNSREREQLLVDLTVNGQRQREIALAEQAPDGTLLISAEKWIGARLVPLERQTELSDGTPAYALNAVPGAQYRLDRQSQSLEVQVPPQALQGSTLSTESRLTEAPPRPAPGFMLNYDANHTRASSGTASATGAALEAIAFGGFGNVVTSALVRDDASGREVARLDSFWRFDLPHRMESLVVGDTLGVGGGWSRPVRYGGLRWGRDFTMRPGFVTTPQPSLSGQAALPSTVEVLVNNARRISLPVQPGPFDLPGVPVTTGAGELNLVVRDLLGRETIVRQSYYASSELLAAGLNDFSVEAGWMRIGFGRDSQYENPFVAATLRRGMTSSVTGQGRMEVQRDRQAAGIDVAGLLGTWGLGRAALAGSRHSKEDSEENGHLLQLGFERRTQAAGAALQYEYASRGFAPFGEAFGAPSGLRARERLMANLGGQVWGLLSGGVSYVRQVRWDGDRVNYLGLSLGVPVGGGASLSLSMNRRLDDSRAWSAMINLNVPLQDRVYAGSQVRRQEDGVASAAVNAVRTPPAGPGVGWHVEASTQESQRARAGVQYNSNFAESRVDVASDASGRISTRINASGTLGYLAGMPFASRPVGQGSFAVVQVPGMPGVPVKRSNQVVAITDARGLAFVPGLLPWQKNLIEIDPQDLPLDTEFKATAMEIVPYARSGSLVRFDARRTRQALVVLHQPDGQPVPVGTRVRLDAEGVEFVAGLRGEVWLTDLDSTRQRMKVSWPSRSCELQLNVPDTPGGEPATIGPLVCGKS